MVPFQATETVEPGCAVPVSRMAPAASVALTMLSAATWPVKATEVVVSTTKLCVADEALPAASVVVAVRVAVYSPPGSVPGA